MAKRTEREFHIALGKLLDRVRVQNSWSRESFHTAATHVANISPSEAIRFFKALVEMNLLQPASDRRKLSPNFDTIIWKNEDKRIGFVKEILEMYPNILQSRGRVKGKVYPKRPITHVEEVEATVVEVVQEDVINPLDCFEDTELVEHLRSKGWVVNIYREKTVIETL